MAAAMISLHKSAGSLESTHSDDESSSALTSWSTRRDLSRTVAVAILAPGYLSRRVSLTVESLVEHS